MQVAQAHETVQGGAEKDILETAKDISSALASKYFWDFQWGGGLVP